MLSTRTPEYSGFIHKSRYARWLEKENRRETWDETVKRYMDFWVDRGLLEKDSDIYVELYESIFNLHTMPSMRTIMTAGKALNRDEIAGYNCSAIAVDNVRVFDEAMYILMNGVGLGFSVERQFINKLPEVAEELFESETIISVADSKIGWSSAFRELVSLLYAGKIPKWDVSKVRPSGARLKTFGGRASGAGALDDLFVFTIDLFKTAKGRKLTSIECHDLMCKIADTIIVGGVRRSALISLSNLTDDRMRRAKTGRWWDENPQRALANNSVAYTEKPDFESFLKEWQSLYESKSGERGMFSREACRSKVLENGRRDADHEWLTNPCSEIILRGSGGLCNLSEVVIRADDTLATLEQKCIKAAILGTLQATLTNFRYLRNIWSKNAKEEALLGVSLTGIMDHKVMSNEYSVEEWEDFLGDRVGSFFIDLSDVLEHLKRIVIETNKSWSKKLGIRQSAATTCVKPSGTVSQLVDSASGIHPRYSKYYVRTVRADVNDPLAIFMKEKGFPCEDDKMKPGKGLVFGFPIASPEGATTVEDVTALEQLQLWKIYQDSWCEHKPSITVYYKDSEFLAVGQWLYNNFDKVSGVSFLPFAEHTYVQAPYQPVNEETYIELLSSFPDNIDFDELELYEKEDNTKGTQELACSAGVCELVDI